MSDQGVAIITDSAASLPPGGGALVVPMKLVLDGEELRDGLDLTATEFYRRLRSLNETPTTSGPSPQGFLDTFEHAAQRFSSILCITVSPAFSSTYAAATVAIEAARKTLPELEIHLMDSGSAAGGEGLVVIAAQKAADSGASLPEVREAAERVGRRVSLLAYLDTLYYVWKGGRVPMIAYAGSALLGLKPVLEMANGRVRNVARPRTRRRAGERLLRLMGERVGSAPVHANVMHGDALPEAEEMRREIERRFDCREIYVTEFSPVMGAHTGSGLLGAAFWTE
jgi:DegV family protein with EDD domain